RTALTPLVRHAAVGVLQREDAELDLPALDGLQDTLGADQLHDLDLAEAVVARVLERGLLGERAADPHHADAAHVTQGRSPLPVAGRGSEQNGASDRCAGWRREREERGGGRTASPPSYEPARRTGKSAASGRSAGLVAQVRAVDVARLGGTAVQRPRHG